MNLATNEGASAPLGGDTGRREVRAGEHLRACEHQLTLRLAATARLGRMAGR
jgi:hypothetical protein